MPVGGQLEPDEDSNETSDRHQYPYMEKDIIVNNSKIIVFIRINSKERNERREGEREERGEREGEGEREGGKGEREERGREGGKGERGREGGEREGTYFSQFEEILYIFLSSQEFTVYFNGFFTLSLLHFKKMF